MIWSLAFCFPTRSENQPAINIGRLPIRRRQAIGLTILLFSHRSSVIKPSQPMRAAGREPTGGEIPVELVSRQPLDDFPKQRTIRGVEDK